METKTKIIATVGPASADIGTIQSLIGAGVDLFRLNFSHGSLDEHSKNLEIINTARAQTDNAIGVIGDLCGPKIRAGRIKQDQQILSLDDQVIIDNAVGIGTATHFGTNYPDIVNDVTAGQRILLDDGQIALQVIRKEDEKVYCAVVVPGQLKSNKGINLPDSEISSPAITEKDWQCAQWAIENKLDYLALSFVRSAAEIIELKKYLADAGCPIKVIAKIEKPQAVENLESIVIATDAVMVARGDLGVEMDFAQVPLIQKRITKMCRRLGKPVIIATQMLQSMITSPVATRAEASDISNAIMDYADALMLSGETAVGQYPIEAVTAIRRISHVTEQYLDSVDEPRPKIDTDNDRLIMAATARSVAQIVDDTLIKAVAIWSETGQTACIISKTRIDVPIIAISPDERICRQLSLHYGIEAFHCDAPKDVDRFVEMADILAVKRKIASPDEQIIVLLGRSMLTPDTTNAILFHTVSQ